MTKDQITGLLDTLNRSLFQGTKQIDKSVVDIWLKVLYHESFKACKKAYEEICKEWRFNYFPKPYQFMEYVKSIKSGSDTRKPVDSTESSKQISDRIKEQARIEFIRSYNNPRSLKKREPQVTDAKELDKLLKESKFAILGDITESDVKKALG